MFCSPAYNKVVYCYVMNKLYFLIAGLSVFGCKLFVIPVGNIQKYRIHYILTMSIVIIVYCDKTSKKGSQILLPRGLLRPKSSLDYIQRYESAGYATITGVFG